METSKRKFNERQSEHTNPENRYEIAYIRVKRIKGFYVHLMVYVFVNAVLICSNYYGNSNEDSFSLSAAAIVAFPLTGISKSAKPTEEITRIVLSFGTEIVNTPSASEITATLEPLILIVAPGIGCPPVLLVTLPEIFLCWENTKVLPSSIHTRNSILTKREVSFTSIMFLVLLLQVKKYKHLCNLRKKLTNI